MSDDRSILLAAGADRAVARNEKTIVLDLSALRRGFGEVTDPVVDLGPTVSFEDAFVRNYQRLRASLSRRSAPGVAVFAATGSGVHGEAWIAASAGSGETPRPLMVGRHGCADLFLPMDSALSLRHFLVLARRSPEGRVRMRVVDLRSDAGLHGEDDERLSGVEADGPLLLRAAGLRFFLIPTPLPRFWSDDPHEAWRALPARCFVDAPVARTPTARPLLPAPKPLSDLSREVTMITMIAAPAFPTFQNLLDEGESTLGHLSLSSRFSKTTLSIGLTAARRGILIGRYERCDAGGLSTLNDESVSRVHALILGDRDGLWLCDTASTNGSVRAGVRERIISLGEGTEIRLGSIVAKWFLAG